MLSDAFGALFDWFEMTRFVIFYQQENKGFGYDLWMKVGDAVLKVGNLAIIVWIFYKNYIERRRERMRDRSLEACNFMVCEVIWAPNQAELSKFYDELPHGFLAYTAKFKKAEKKGISNARDLLGDEIDRFRLQHHALRQRIAVPLMQVFPGFNQLALILEELEDRYTEVCEKILISNDSAETEAKMLTDFIESSRGKFLKAFLTQYRQLLHQEENANLGC